MSAPTTTTTATVPPVAENNTAAVPETQPLDQQQPPATTTTTLAPATENVAAPATNTNTNTTATDNAPTTTPAAPTNETSPAPTTSQEQPQVQPTANTTAEQPLAPATTAPSATTPTVGTPPITNPPLRRPPVSGATTPTGESSLVGAIISATLPDPPKILKPTTVAAARTEGAKLLAKSAEIGRNLELEPGYTQGLPAYKKQRENLAATSSTTVSTLSNLKAALDTARWQRLQYGNIAGALSSKVTDVRDRVEDEEARVAANPVDKAKNIAIARSQLLRDLAMRREVFTLCGKWASNVNTNKNNEQSASSSPSPSSSSSSAVVDIRTAELDLAIRYADEWPSFVHKARATLQTVDSDSHQLHGVEGSVPAAEQGLLAQCEELIKQHGITWLREGQRRKNYEASLRSFFADHAKLMQWCRQRLATLSGLTQPEHIQEFCASFRNSTAVMGSNLLVLLESSSALIPNKEVERALLDISETWLGLETFAYERLRTTLLEQHTKCGLEAEARAWPEYSKKLINSLTEAQRLLNETNDASSAKLLASLKDSCAQLIQDHDAHLLIVEHLADFSVREECLSDHYRALRAMIFSRITMLCQTFAGLTFPRRAEYSDCVAEASAWVESKTKSDAWQDMLERVEHIRLIIEKSDGLTTEN